MRERERDTERQRGREAERQRDRETEGLGIGSFSYQPCTAVLYLMLGSRGCGFLSRQFPSRGKTHDGTLSTLGPSFTVNNLMRGMLEKSSPGRFRGL